jgi:hypothetical protein
MMNRCMAFPAKGLQVTQRVVARATVSAPSTTAAVAVMDSKIVISSTSLTSEVIPLQRLLSVTAEVEVVARLAKVAVKPLLRHTRHTEPYDFRSLFRGAAGAARLWAAVVDVISLTVGALVDCSNNAGVGLTSIPSHTLFVVPGADDGNARDARFLALARGFVGNAAFFADSLTKASFGLPMSRQRAGNASFGIGRLLYHQFAAAGTDDGSVRSRCHGPSYAGG